MDIKQLEVLRDAKKAEAAELLNAESPDVERAGTLIDEAEGYQKRIDLMRKTLTPKVEPATEQKSGLVTVVADEEDKQKAVKTWTMGEFFQAVALAPDTVRAYRSTDLPDHYNVTQAVGAKAIGSLHQAKEAARKAKAITGLSESVPADGGFLVQTDWGGRLMD